MDPFDNPFKWELHSSDSQTFRLDVGKKRWYYMQTNTGKYKLYDEAGSSIGKRTVYNNGIATETYLYFINVDQINEYLADEICAELKKTI